VTSEVTGLFKDNTPPTSYPTGKVVIIMVVSAVVFIFIVLNMPGLSDVCQSLFIAICPGHHLRQFSIRYKYHHLLSLLIQHTI
jgi:hypothetical protein